MTAVFCWARTRIGTIEALVFHTAIPKKLEGMKIIAQHPMTEEDYDSVRVQMKGKSAIDVLAQRYPPPPIAEDL